jgi:hypothetical protein
LLAHVATHAQGTLVVEGKRSYVFHLPDGRRVTGADLLSCVDWAWHDSAQLPGFRYVRRTALSPTYGPVTVVIVDTPGRERYYLLCQATPIAATRLIRAWRRRSAIEHFFRTLKHLLATEPARCGRKRPITGIWSRAWWLAWSCRIPPVLSAKAG